MRTVLAALFACCCALAVSPALAVSLDFSIATPTVQLGQQATVDVVISGLGSGIPPSIGCFDMDVSFDPSVLSVADVSFGPYLGSESGGEALSMSAPGSGVVQLASVSLLPNPDLDALQPASFTLATLTFSTLSVGSSPLSFSYYLVDDGNGDKLPINTGGGGVYVIPEPPALLSVLCGVGALQGAFLRRKMFGRRKTMR